MKRIALYLGVAAAMVASCSIQEEDFKAPVQDDVIFYASFEQPSEGTKVYANENLYLRWTADDRVSIFNKLTYNQQYKFLGETGDNSGGFNRVDAAEFVTGNEIPHVVSVYPYQEGTKISEEEVLNLTLPAEQHYAANTFGLGANTMVSVSEDNVLQYKNVGGYLRLRLYGEGISVTSITLKGNNGEKLAGKASVTMPLHGTPTAVLADDATDEITLICDTPIALGATAEECKDFWFVVPPVSFSQGFTVSVFQSSGGAFKIFTSKNISIERSKLSKMSPFGVKYAQPKNVIIYTSTDGKIVTPRNDDFGAVLLSNEYKDGYGVITFDNDVTSIGGYAFLGCTTLSSLSIPEGVTEIGAAPFCEAYALTSIVVDSNNPYFDSRDDCNAIIETETNQLVSGCKKTRIPSSVTSIKEGAFYGCTNLNTIVIPSSITSIGDAAFGHTGLFSLSIPESVTSIGRNPFYDCPYLSSISVASGNSHYDSRDDCNAIIETNTNQLIIGCIGTTIPSSVTSIGIGAFEACAQLRHITIPEGVTSIGASAFNSCIQLNSVDIASSVTRIDRLAFYSCSNLISVTVRAALPPSIEYGSFELSNNSVIYVPSGSVDAYKSAQVWSNYADLIQAIPSPTVPVPVSSIELDQTSVQLMVGESVTLIATVKPDDATDKTVTWSSSDPSMATVDGNGKVTAVKEGSATITAKAGEKSASCSVSAFSSSVNPNSDYFSLTAIEYSTVKLVNCTWTVEISYDKITWQVWDCELINLPPNTSVFFRANQWGHRNSGGLVYTSFGMKGKIAAAGNIMSLLYYDDFQDKEQIKPNCFFHGLFAGCDCLVSAPELPATTLANYCYSNMFAGCTSLTKAPDLPAIALAEDCYSNMFASCTSLTQAPDLPATILTRYCYKGMFAGCTSLTKAPDLPATALASNCYSNMFAGCTSLTKAPDLPATTLADFSYSNMFEGCTSLTQAPSLPATTLANYCYSNMFENCTSLTQAPNLPATTLVYSCYYFMFAGCTSLTKVPDLPAISLADLCYFYMFKGCTSLTQAPNLPATTLAESSYGSMFFGCTSLTKAPNLPATALAISCYSNMFANCTSLTQAPNLPATTLATSCYSNMFANCTSLTQAPDLPATRLAKSCYKGMFADCTGLTLAPELPATALSEYCYQTMFSGCTGLTKAPVLPALVLVSGCYYEMFKDSKNLNYVKMMATSYLTDSITGPLGNWLGNVSKSGTFVQNANASWDQWDIQYIIPSGWTVQTATN